jgi:penicillin amidase
MVILFAKIHLGKFKDTGIRHLLRIPALGRLHLPIGGGEHIINATKPTHGPSCRLIVHLTDKIEAFSVYPGGQNGNPGSKYYDSFVDNWVSGKYYPILFLNADEARQSKQIKWTITFSKA